MSVLRIVTKILQGIKLLNLVVRQDILQLMAPRYPLKPTRLRLSDVDGRETKIGSKELSKLLAAPLFSEVQHVDIAVSVMSLYRDLFDSEVSFANSLTKLKSINLFMEVHSHQIGVSKILAMARSIQMRGIHFSMDISLAGPHDISLPAENWPDRLTSTAETIKTIEQNSVPVSVNYRLTPTNCYWADDVLLWCEEERVQQWAFYLDTDAKRFDTKDCIQPDSFSPEQLFHVIMFFDKLARQSGIDRTQRVFYRSLVGQLAFGLQRKANCYWQTSGITLSIEGNLSFCPPKSNAIGSILKKDAFRIYKEGVTERRHIIQNRCNSCCYDSPSPLSSKYLIDRGVGLLGRQAQRYQNKLFHSKSILPRSIKLAKHNTPNEWKHVLITGWYGTETTGDKAILGEVLHFIKTHSPGCQITLTSMDRKVSQQTNTELSDLKHVKLVDMAQGDNPALIESVDAVIIGGGPLMEIPEMEYIRQMFWEANRQQKARVIFGCGIGPLYTDQMHQVTKAILQMTTAGFLRDQESYEYAVKRVPGNVLTFACDPAVAFLMRWLRNDAKVLDLAPNEHLRVVGLLRANTTEFMRGLSKIELAESNGRVAARIARFLETACRKANARTDLLPMNSPWIGGDDRLFNRLVVNACADRELIRVERAYLPLDAVIQSLASAHAATVMRYHGHLFAMTLGIPFLSVDYAGGNGKVRRLLRRIGYEQWSEEWQGLDIDRAASRLQQLLDERLYWAEYLKEKAETLVDGLHQTYARVFAEV